MRKRPSCSTMPLSLLFGGCESDTVCANDEECESSYCEKTYPLMDSGVCRPYAPGQTGLSQFGEWCSQDTHCKSNNCDQIVGCMREKVLLGVGEECEKYVDCASGACKKWGKEKKRCCPLLSNNMVDRCGNLPMGAECLRDEQCISNVCMNGKCQRSAIYFFISPYIWMVHKLGKTPALFLLICSVFLTSIAISVRKLRGRP